MEKCTDHKFIAVGFDTIKTDPMRVEAIAAISCEKCGLFRTKILTFMREIMKDQQL